MKIFAAVLSLFAVCLAAPGCTSDTARGAMPDGWEKLGERRVDFNTDHDEIRLSNREGKFNTLRLKAMEGSVDIHKVVVHYDDGSMQDITMSDGGIPAGGESRLLELSDSRVISTVDFWYHTPKSAGEKAVVELWGFNDAARKPADAATSAAPKWEKLGSRAVNYSLDRDEIALTNREGSLGAFKLTVKDAPLAIHKVVVHHNDGTTQEVEMSKDEIPAGGESKMVDLNKSSSPMSKVAFWYRSTNPATEKAEVELWGIQASAAQAGAGDEGKAVKTGGSAATGGWEKIGERKVDYKVDHDEISLGSKEARFNALKIVVEDGNLSVHKAVVHYDDGTTQDVDMTRSEVADGGQSRLLNLKTADRNIKKVAFWYHSKKTGDEKVEVALWGRK